MNKKELRKKLEAEIGRAIVNLLKKINGAAADKSQKTIREASKAIAKKFYKNSGEPKEAPVKRVVGIPAVKKTAVPAKPVKAAAKRKK